jgi:hypothetical protein
MGWNQVTEEAEVAVTIEEVSSPKVVEELVREVSKGRKAKVKSDMVNNPEHYKIGGIETIDFIEAKNFGYNLGNVIKYVSRADHKGRKLEDLEKAQWYLMREIANIKEKANA